MMIVFAVVLSVLGCGLALVGFLVLTQATTGVGLIGLACFVGILARLAQASSYHQQQLDMKTGVV
jgi:hypothetical protein